MRWRVPFLGFAFLPVASAAPADPGQLVRVPVVGMLVTHAAVNDPGDALRAALREFGYEDGRNIRFEIVTAAGELNRLPRLAKDLVGQNVDVIVCPNEASVRAARGATSSIPIVMQGFVNDPVASGLINSFGRPGGNITGIYSLSPELQSKRLELLKETLPSLSRVALLWDSSFPIQFGEELQRAGNSLGVRLQPIEVRGARDLDRAFRVAKRTQAGAVMLMGSPMFYVQRTRVAALALDEKLPTISMLNQAVEAGALLSYGQDLVEVWRRTAYYIDRLLKGAKPSDLPVEQVSNIRLAVNLKTAKALGITIPESILLRADEVIR